MKNIKQPSVFSNVFQIAPHVPELSPFSLISIYVHPLWKITSWTPPPLFPITITNSPLFTLTVISLWSNLCTSYKVRVPAIRIFSKSEDSRLKSSIPSFGFRVFPETRFPILDGQTSCLKSSRSEFGLICDKKLSLISRLEFFFLFSLNKQREDLPFLAKEKYWNIRFNLVIAYFCFMWKYRDIIVYLLLIYDLRLSINENNL